MWHIFNKHCIYNKKCHVFKPNLKAKIFGQFFLSNGFASKGSQAGGCCHLTEEISRIEPETTIVIMWHGSPSLPRLSPKPRGERDQIGLSSCRKLLRGTIQVTFLMTFREFWKDENVCFSLKDYSKLSTLLSFKLGTMIWQKWHNEWAKTTRTLSSWHCFPWFCNYSWETTEISLLFKVHTDVCNAMNWN